MANYTAADVKRLRELTAAGMMACKNALEETDGDFDKAVEILRIKGAKDVGKRAGRTATNGLVTAEDGVIVQVLCETDFVAKTDGFQEFAGQVLAAAKAARPADVAALLAAEYEGKTVAAVVDEFSAKLAEKLEVGKVAVFDGTTATYLHRRSADLPPAVGVVVEYTGDDADAARAIAMQVAALRAAYVTRDEVSEDVVANERRIAEETAREEGKPEAALSKIVEGRVNGFFKEVVLLEQASVTDSKKTVKAQLAEAGIAVTRFARFEVGQA
jgi:elongation factor Ts